MNKDFTLFFFQPSRGRWSERAENGVQERSGGSATWGVSQRLSGAGRMGMVSRWGVTGATPKHYLYVSSHTTGSPSLLPEVECGKWPPWPVSVRVALRR